MKKNNGVAAILAVNAVILGVVALNAYKPRLADIAQDFVKLKKNKSKKTYKLEKKKILELAEKKIPDENKLLINMSTKCEIIPLKNNLFMNDKIRECLINNYKQLPMVVKDNQVLCLPMKNLERVKNSGLETLEEFVPHISIPQNLTLPTKDFTFKHSILTMAMIILLNSLGYNTLVDTLNDVNFSEEAIEETIEDIEEFFVDTYDVVTTLNNHEAIVNRKVNRIMESDLTIEQKLYNIFNLDELSREEKISSIIAVEGIDNKTKFEFFINSGYFEIKEAALIIANSSLPTFTDSADYVMNMDNIPIDDKIDAIMSVDVISYTEVFDYVLSCQKINNSLKGEYIAMSSLANSEEKFNYFMQSDISLNEKVWYSMQIPDIPFEKLFNDLLNVEGINQDEVITAIMATDLVSFDKLFDNILNIPDITTKQVSNYLIYFNSYYNNGFNTIELKDLVNYALNLEMNEHDKVECFWGLLNNLSLEDKEIFIQSYYNVDIKEYLEIYFEANNNYITEDKQILLDLYVKINEEKREYILEHYGMTLEELSIVIAGCAAESYYDYDDIYWVINTIFNRITHPRYSKKGINPYLQFIAPGQFQVYSTGSYLNYLNPTDETYLQKRIIAEQAVLDMLYLGYDGCEHNFIEFRSWGISDFSNNYVVEHGNRYKITLADENRIEYDFLDASTRDEEPAELTLTNNKSQLLY